MIRDKKNSGFTLLEWSITLLALIAMLAVVLPVVVSEQRRVNAEQALDQLGHYTDPVFNWVRDCKPTLKDKTLDLMIGPGAIPNGLEKRRAGELLSVLTKKDKLATLNTEDDWKGPYLTHMPTDPWGHSYILMGLSEGDAHAWFLSVGANGKLETSAADISLKGDDFGVRLR